MKIREKLSKRSKIISFSLAVLMLFGVMAAVLVNRQDVVESNAAVYYDSASALSYAKSHWNDGKGLCAEFVSDCLKEGGLKSYSVSSTSLMTQLQNNYEGTIFELQTYGDKIRLADNIGKVAAGDPIFWYCSHCKRYMHTALCNGASNAGNLVNYAHNGAQNGNSEVYIGSCYQCHNHYSSMYSVHFSFTVSDATEPTITESGAYMLDSENLLVWGLPNDDVGITSVKIATWTNNGSDVVWRDAVNNGSGIYFVTFPLSDYGNAEIYYSDIYAYDAGENSAKESVIYYNDSMPPSVVESGAYMFDPQTLLVWGTPSDNIGISAVRIATWTNNDSQVIWRDAVDNGHGTYFVLIPLSDYGEADIYYSHVYAYDLAENYDGVEVVHHKDKTPPSILESGAYMLDSENLLVWGTPNDDVGISAVKIATWDDKGTEAVWRDAVDNGSGTYFVTFPLSEYGDADVLYSDIYAYDTTGNSNSKRVEFCPDRTGSVISDVQITELTKNGYRVTCHVEDDSGVKCVRFPTWRVGGDVIWHEGELNGNTATCYISAADHDGLEGVFHTHIYAYDIYDNDSHVSATGSDTEGVYVDKTDPQITASYAIDVTSTQYIIVADYSDNHKVKRVSLATWSGDNQSDIVWRDIEVINGSASWTIDATHCMNSEKCFWNDVYVWDECGNSAMSSVNVYIPEAIESIVLSQTTAIAKVGDTFSLTATVTPANTTDTIEWTSSNPSVATVSNGNVTAVALGTATITATIGSVSATCTVTVEAAAPVNYDVKPNINGGASKLYEPWGLRYYAAFTGTDIDKIADRGIAILKNTYYTADMSPAVFCANENTHIFMDSQNELTFEKASTNYPNGRYYATLTDGIYSYDISAYYYVVPFAVMNDGQTIYGSIKKNSMEKILNSNLNLSSVTAAEKAVCTCILELKNSVASHYAATGVPGASLSMTIPRGSSQQAATSVKTTAQSGITPNVNGAASRLIEPWGLRYFAVYTDNDSIADRGQVILCEKYFNSSYNTNPDSMRQNANAYVFRESDGTMEKEKNTSRYYATLTEGISSKDISDVYYVVPFVVLNDGSYVYGTVKSNSMMKIMQANLKSSTVPVTEREVSQDIIDLYNAVKVYNEERVG